jgi:CBS-domain-containing membrane protein
MNVADIMTARVLTIRNDAPITEAVRLMLQRRISGLPVVDADDNLVGMVSEGDFLRRTETGTERHRPRWLEFLASPGGQATDYVHAHGRKVADVMSAEPIAVSEKTPIGDAVSLMEKHRIKRLPVLRERKVVGIVSRADLLRALARAAAKLPSPSKDDTAIRNAIYAELDKQSWVPRATINIAVASGIAELHGTILDERERRALRVAVENVPGVKGVHDELVWIEPVSGMYLEAPAETKASAPR